MSLPVSFAFSVAAQVDLLLVCFTHKNILDHNRETKGRAYEESGSFFYGTTAISFGLIIDSVLSMIP